MALKNVLENDRPPLEGVPGSPQSMAAQGGEGEEQDDIV